MRRLLNKPDRRGRIFLAVALFPFALLWGEMFTRVLLPQNVDSKMNIFTADPVVGFTFKPNAKTYEKGKEYNALYEINTVGLRDREYGAKHEGLFRVLLLGDSFSVSHGLPIEESLSRQMERALHEAANADGGTLKFEVINAAVGGYSPYNYWRAYQRWAPLFKPDAVLVGLSPDDYECDNENAYYLIENGETLAVFKDGQVAAKSGKISIKKIRKWLSWNSEFYILLRNFFYYNDLVGRITRWIKPGGVENENQLQLYRVSYQENAAKAWAKSFSYLENLHEDTASDGVKLILIPIPLKMEIDSGEYRQLLVSKGLKKEEIDRAQQLRVISAFCKKEKIPLLDPRPAMEERHAKVPCYFGLDGHWNTEGVRIASDSLARQWRDLGLPPWRKD